MASGKTTVGRLVSEATGMPLVDTDILVEESAGMAVREIFETGGEEGFRRLERQMIARESARDGVVLAVGGGAVLDPRNVAELRRGGVLYLLDVTAGEVADRVGADGGRPLLPEGPGEVERLMSERSGPYLEAADVVVPTTGREPLDVARDIISDFRSRSEAT